MDYAFRRELRNYSGNPAYSPAEIPLYGSFKKVTSFVATRSKWDDPHCLLTAILLCPL